MAHFRFFELSCCVCVCMSHLNRKTHTFCKEVGGHLAGVPKCLHVLNKSYVFFLYNHDCTSHSTHNKSNKRKCTKHTSSSCPVYIYIYIIIKLLNRKIRTMPSGTFLFLCVVLLCLYVPNSIKQNNTYIL